MINVLVMYPSGADAKFDLDYYLGKHMPLVHEKWDSMGLKSAKILKGTGTGDGKPAPYQIVAVLEWESMQHFQNAGKTHGKEIFGDIPNFTNTQPTVQINDIAG